MTAREAEPTRFLEVPRISEKISSEQLVIWSKQRWPSDARRRLAADIIDNGKELLKENNIDWDSVLRNIRVLQFNNPYVGAEAIACSGARIIGGLAIGFNWSMHDSPAVYLSGKLLADRVKDSEELDDFKSLMRQSAKNYGEKTLPNACLYMETLDFLLLEFKPRTGYGKIIEQLRPLLEEGDTEGVYRIIKPRGDLVRRRGL